MDLLQQEPPSDEGAQAPELGPHVLEVLRRFPPLRTELHFVPFATARIWVKSLGNRGQKIAHYDGDDWAIAGEATTLRPDALLVLPTGAAPSSLSGLLDEVSDLELAQCDVFDRVSGGAARYRRRIQVTGSSSQASLVHPDVGVHQIVFSHDEMPKTPDETSPHNDDGWKSDRLQLLGDVKGLSVKLIYLRKTRPVTFPQSLEKHHAEAEQCARKLASVVAPGNDFMARLLEYASSSHDLGKADLKWQRAMGNPAPENPISKPIVERPASTNGYRHEWGSLSEIVKLLPSLPDDWEETTRQLWLDLWLHLVAAHHGYFRPSMSDRGFAIPPVPSKQFPMRLQEIERYARLQRALGPWRLAYLESLLKTADVEASQELVEDHSYES
jgi:CRISPR-associated helicase Cas3